MSYQNSPPDPLDQKILAAAHRLLAGGDEAAFTMDQLAEASGVSRATLYRRVGSREALLKRLAEEHGLEISELDGLDIRQRILTATRASLAKSGSVNFTIEQVADEAGVGVATIYRHFGTKEGLLEAFAQLVPPRRAALDLSQHPSGDLQVDLTHFAAQTLQFMYEFRDMGPIYLSGNVKVRELFTTLRGDQNRTITYLTHYLETQIQAGLLPQQDAFDLATAFVGMMVGFAFIRASYTDDLVPPEQAAETIVRIFLSGIQEIT